MLYAVMGAIILIIVGVFFYLAKKDGSIRNSMLESLTEEQKEKLMATDIQFIEGKNEWIQLGMIGSMTEKGNKYSCKVLWYNKVIQTNLYEQIQYGDLSIDKKEKEAHDIKPGDFVKVYIAPEKTVGSFKIVFDE